MSLAVSMAVVFFLWVEGGNHETNGNRSIDSRIYGAVCRNNVIGIAERIVWPPTSWGVFCTPILVTTSHQICLFQLLIESW